MSLITSNDVSRSAVADDLVDTFDCMRPLIEDKVVVVTGATRGIGRGLALYFSRLGAKVAINGRDAVLVEEVVQQAESLPGPLIGLAGDIANADHRSELVRFAESNLGPIDVLVNNAAVIAEAPLSTMTTEQWRYVLGINLDAVFELSRAVAITSMLPRATGSIINFSSVCGSIVMAGHGNYSAAKAGIEMLTRAFAVEWGSQGVRVNAIAPGYVKTRMNQDQRADEQVRQAMLDQTPAGRFGELEDIVGPTLFLSTPLSSWCHGSVLTVDGAYTCI